MEKPIGIIYITTNKINNKRYIGKHKGFKKDNYLGSGTLLKKAIKKYSKENFKRETLCYCYSDEELNEKEKFFIKMFNAIKRKDFYNIHEGGEGGKTTLGWNESQKKSFSKKMSSLTSGEKNGMYGKKHSKEAIERLKHKAKNRSNKKYKSINFSKKMSSLTSGEKNGMYGKKHSKEAIEKMKKNKKKLFKENNPNYGNIDENAKNGVKVYKYIDLNEEPIEVFNTLTLVLKSLKIKNHTALNRAIKNQTKYKNYYWKKEIRCRD